jgi:hypothetical protein
MAFSSSTFLPLSAQANSNASRAFVYNTGDNTATVGGANYFDAAADPAGGLGLKTDDYIFCTQSDGTDIYQASVSAGVVTLALSVAFS